MVKPYRREEPTATMTHTEPGVNASGDTYDDRLDAGLADAQKAAADVGVGKVDPRDDLRQAVLFHPAIDTQLKVLLLQMLWIGKEVTADDLTKGTGITNLSVQHSLRKAAEHGFVTSRYFLPNPDEPMTEKGYKVTDELGAALGKLTGPETGE